MLQSLKENADEAYPCADVQTFLSAEPALDYAEKFGCDVLLCEISNAAEAKWIFNQGSNKCTDSGRTAKSAVSGCMNQTTALMKEERPYDRQRI